MKALDPTALSRRLLRAGRWAAGCVGVLLLIALAGMVAVDQVGQRDDASATLRVDAIIVLGGVLDRYGQPRDSLRQRTLHAVELYRRGIAPVLLFTGGEGEFPPAESVAAAALARSEGVPKAAIALETRSRTTRENARYGAEICWERGWKRVLCVSDPSHLARVRLHFGRQGLTVYTSPARASAVNRIPELRVRQTWLELIHLVRDAVR